MTRPICSQYCCKIIKKVLMIKIILIIRTGFTVKNYVTNGDNLSPLSHSLKQQNRRRHCGVQRFRAARHRDDDTLVHETRRFR